MVNNTLSEAAAVKNQAKEGEPSESKVIEVARLAMVAIVALVRWSSILHPVILIDFIAILAILLGG